MNFARRHHLGAETIDGVDVVYNGLHGTGGDWISLPDIDLMERDMISNHINQGDFKSPAIDWPLNPRVIQRGGRLEQQVARYLVEATLALALGMNRVEFSDQVSGHLIETS